jgi:hypothetical protein
MINRLTRRRYVGELIVGILCLLVSARFLIQASSAASDQATFAVAYRGSVGPATPTQGYVGGALFLLVGAALIVLFITSGRTPGPQEKERGNK